MNEQKYDDLLACAKRLLAASDGYDETEEAETFCRLTIEDLRDAVAKVEGPAPLSPEQP